jgi:hypothetical protein
MNIIDVHDGGLATNEKANVTVGVINMIVTNGDATPETITGYCRPEIKQSLIRILNNEIAWEQPH